MDAAKYEALQLHRIVLLAGAGELRFGVTPEQARQLLGDPDYAETNPSYPRPGTPPESWPDRTMWGFEAVDLHLEFEPEGEKGGAERLVVLWTENPIARLLDVPFIGQPFSRTRAALDRVGVRYQGLQRLKGIDLHDFDRGLTVHAFGDAIERVEWTILTGDSGEPIDWSAANRIG